MDLEVTTPPTTFTIDSTLVKANKRITQALEDTLIDFWIGVADDYVERQSNRALMTQSITLRLQRVLCSVELPRPPLQSVTSLKYTPENSSEVTVDVSTLVRRSSAGIPIIEIPSIESECAGEMEIVYVAGAADTASVPQSLRQASLLLASHYTTSREAAFMDPRIMNVEKRIAFGVDQLIGKHKIHHAYPYNSGY